MNKWQVNFIYFLGVVFLISFSYSLIMTPQEFKNGITSAVNRCDSAAYEIRQRKKVLDKIIEDYGVISNDISHQLNRIVRIEGYLDYPYE